MTPIPKPVIIILGKDEKETPSPLKALLAPLSKLGYTIAFDDRAPKNEASILILGLDPSKHEVPMELAFQLKKLQKDYIMHYGIEPKDETYLKLLKQSGFVPKPKEIESKIILN